MALTETYLDAWQLRCIFRHSAFLNRVAKGEFSVKLNNPRKPGNLSRRPEHPENTRSQFLRYEDRDGNEVAKAHWYVCEGRQITEPDPKVIKIGNTRYIIHPERLVANPEERFPSVLMRKVYGKWRKLACRVFGPVAIVPFETSPTS